MRVQEQGTASTCGEKGRVWMFSFASIAFQDLTVKKLIRAMAMPMDGMTPLVRLSLCTMMENTLPKIAPSTTDRTCPVNQR